MGDFDSNTSKHQRTHQKTQKSKKHTKYHIIM